MEPRYSLIKEQRMYFSSVLMLELIINCEEKFPNILSEKQKSLDDILIHMICKKWVIVENGIHKATDEGREVLVNHKEKLVEFRQLYKVFSAVDLGVGHFAYKEFFDYENDEDFFEYAYQENFEDLRVALCEMKKINPLEVIFLEFMESGRFNNWEEDIVSNEIWNEIVEIANTNLHIEDLEEKDSDGVLVNTGEFVMTIIIRKGLELSKELMERQIQIEQDLIDAESINPEEVIEETITTTTTEEVVEYVDEPYYDVYYYEPYYDPFFVSACWLAVWY